jgi:hypothetical protein
MWTFDDSLELYSSDVQKWIINIENNRKEFTADHIFWIDFGYHFGFGYKTPHIRKCYEMYLRHTLRLHNADTIKEALSIS